LAKDRAAAIAVDGATGSPPHADDPGPRLRQLDDALGSGDADTATKILVELYGTAVYRYCRRMLGADADGEDISQTVFTQALQALRRKTPVENPRSWLLGIARHRCLDRLARRKTEPIPIEAEELERTMDRDPIDEILPLDPRTVQALDDCLDALDRRSRVVVLLRFQDHLSYEAIGKLTGDKPGALRVRVSRALFTLRRCLEKKGGLP
jgi:RNA polymerase sigma-70 factor (ECF subfamily)